MKKVLVIICLAAGITLSAQNRDEGRAFTVRGEIIGLAVGDTLRFERVELPGFSLAPGFDVVATVPDRFEYTGRQPHIEYYMMSCLPRGGELPESVKRGLTMLVDGGTVTVTGTRDDIYTGRVEGEAFGEQPLLREAQELDDSLARERSRYLRLGRAALAAGDSVAGREYIRQFNEFRQTEASKRIEELHGGFLRRHPSSPWSLAYRLQRASNTPVDTLEAYYATLDAEARAGHYGTLLRTKIDAMASLLPGRPAPGFRVTLPDGTVMDSDAFRGKYLLIYHWGFCPGSLQLETQAVELYNRFKDRFEVLGITESLDAIRKAAVSTTPEEKLYGIGLKAAYESMAAHPWIDVEEAAGENSRISELYAFAGFPFFVLVSPDGKIVSRGFHSTFFEAKKILENQNQNEPEN